MTCNIKNPKMRKAFDNKEFKDIMFRMSQVSATLQSCEHPEYRVDLQNEYDELKMQGERLWNTLTA